MHVLVADDDRVGRRILARALQEWAFDVIEADDGEAAWAALTDARPPLSILDWMMPKLDGLELCRRIRQDAALATSYVLLLTARDDRHDLVRGLEAGADDYLVKPFDPEELHARVNVGVRVVGLQQRLADRIVELQKALANVRQLRSLLPICSYCKRIRSDDNYWEQIESYLAQHSEAQFSHGVCPSCLERAMDDLEVPSSERPQARPKGRFKLPWRRA